MYPDQSALLAAKKLPMWIDKEFLRADPYAFQVRDVNLFRDFALEFAESLDVDPNGVYCVGSGAIGLSLNPRKVKSGSLKVFDNKSDLDIAVISPYHFETAWRDLRIASHPAYEPPPSKRLLEKIDHQRKRMFDGAIVANELLSRLSFGDKWVTHRRRASLVWADRLERPSQDINVWIYRDYWSVRSYVAEGVLRCLARVSEDEQ